MYLYIISIILITLRVIIMICINIDIDIDDCAIIFDIICDHNVKSIKLKVEYYFA